MLGVRYDLVQGDLAPIGIKLDDLTDTIPDTATITFAMRQADGVKHVSGLAVLDDAGFPGGEASVHYQWKLGETDTPGIYRAQVHVVVTGQGPESWPSSDDALYIVIHPAIN